MPKSSTRSAFGSPTISNLVLLATSLHLTVGLITHILWLVRGNQALFRYYFSYEDPLFLVLCTMLELSLAYCAWKQFSPGQTLRQAWLLIMISAACHVVGAILTHILSMDSYISPLYVFGRTWFKMARALILPLGAFIGGPVQMVALGGGLYLALHQCRKFKIPGKMKATDWIILGIVLAYTLQVMYVVHRLASPSPRLTEVITWGNDPLLCLLLFFAFFLRRSVAQMGWGLVTKCWGAYVVAILGTSIASMGMWATDFGILPYPENAVLWYVWPIMFAAYALGPAYQVEAAHVALARLKDFRENPAPKVPTRVPKDVVESH